MVAVKHVSGRFCVYVDGNDTGKWASSEAKAKEIASRFEANVRPSAPVRPVAPAPKPAPTVKPAPAPRPARPRVVREFPGGVMLAKPYADTDPTGWWMSEKLDGVRAYWTGDALYTRNGNRIMAPEWFTRDFPAMALDGELMAGRGRFNVTVSVVRKQKPVDAEWKRIKFHVFDAPMQSGGCEDRWRQMNAEVAGVPNIVVVEQIACKSPKHLAEVRAQVAALGGEGVMLRKARSAYEQKRTSALQKVKSFMDTEARIVGYLPGEGKHAGRLGAYEAVLLKGSKQKFGIGTGMTDAERERPLPIGTVVTVKFFELTPAGVPRFPTLVGARDYE